MTERTPYRPARPARALALPVLIVAGLALIVILFGQLRAAFDPMERQRQEAEYWRERATAETVAWVDPLVAAGWKLLPLALVSGAAVVALGVIWRRYGWRESIYADKVTAITRANAQRYPAGLHSLSFHESSRALPPAHVAALPEAEPEPLALPVPSFGEMLAAGAIGPGEDGRQQPIVLGYSAGGPIVGDWRSLYSTAIGGLQGSGKSWTAAYLLAQSTIAGARLVVCDPHADDAEGLAHRIRPLAPSFLCDVATTDREILDALKLADDELQRRKRGDKARWPLIVPIDEWSSLRRGALAEKLPAFIEDFSSEGRKFNCHVLLMLHRTDKESVGPFRNTLASAYVHRMRPDDARMLTGLRANALPNDTLQLPTASAYLLTTRGEFVRVTIPRMTAGDLAEVGRRLGGQGSEGRAFGFRPAAREVNGKPTGSQTETRPEIWEVSLEADKPTPEDARIVALFLAGKDVAAIVREVYGATSGRAYQERAAYVQLVIRQALAGARGGP